jgi:hypothetical protein
LVKLAWFDKDKLRITHFLGWRECTKCAVKKHKIKKSKKNGRKFTSLILCSYPARTIRAAFKLAAYLLCTWLEAATGRSICGNIP